MQRRDVKRDLREIQYKKKKWRLNKSRRHVYSYFVFVFLLLCFLPENTFNDKYNRYIPVKAFRSIVSEVSDSIGEIENNLFHGRKENTPLIALDPGHGGNDPGAVVGSIYEMNVNYDVAERIKALLDLEGINSYIVKSKDETRFSTKRIKEANSQGARLFLSIHCNWYEKESINGTTVIYPKRNINYKNLDVEEFATIIHDELLKNVDMRDAGYQKRSDLNIFYYADMPVVLVELGYMSNKEDLKLLKSSKFRADAAEGLANGIKKSLAAAEAD